jgi:hypothetical protein
MTLESHMSTRENFPLSSPAGVTRRRWGAQRTELHAHTYAHGTTLTELTSADERHATHAASPPLALANPSRRRI